MSGLSATVQRTCLTQSMTYYTTTLGFKKSQDQDYAVDKHLGTEMGCHID